MPLLQCVFCLQPRSLSLCRIPRVLTHLCWTPPVTSPHWWGQMPSASPSPSDRSYVAVWMHHRPGEMTGECWPTNLTLTGGWKNRAVWERKGVRQWLRFRPLMVTVWPQEQAVIRLCSFFNGKWKKWNEEMRVTCFRNEPKFTISLLFTKLLMCNFRRSCH